MPNTAYFLYCEYLSAEQAFKDQRRLLCRAESEVVRALAPLAFAAADELSRQMEVVYEWDVITCLRSRFGDGAVPDELWQMALKTLVAAGRLNRIGGTDPQGNFNPSYSMGERDKPAAEQK